MTDHDAFLRALMNPETSPFPEILDWEGWIAGKPVPKRAEFKAAGFERFSLIVHPGIPGLNMFVARQFFIPRYGFALPSHEAVELLVSTLGPTLEVGAGTGSWTALLASRGMDIVATDPQAKDGLHHGFSFGRFADVLPEDAVSAVKARPDRDVLAVWPTYEADWIAKAALAMAPGRRLAVIHEGNGGCIADDSFFDLMESWEEVADLGLPNWPGIHDVLTIWRKPA